MVGEKEKSARKENRLSEWQNVEWKGRKELSPEEIDMATLMLCHYTE